MGSLHFVNLAAAEGIYKIFSRRSERVVGEE